MSLTKEYEQIKHTDDGHGIDTRKVYGRPRVQRIETKDTESGPNNAYNEDAFGNYQSS